MSFSVCLTPCLRALTHRIREGPGLPWSVGWENLPGAKKAVSSGEDAGDDREPRGEAERAPIAPAEVMGLWAQFSCPYAALQAADLLAGDGFRHQGSLCVMRNHCFSVCRALGSIGGVDVSEG